MSAEEIARADEPRPSGISVEVQEDLEPDEDCSQEALDAVKHIPLNKLRKQTAIVSEEVELIHDMLDELEGVEEGFTSMEVTHTRLQEFIVELRQLRAREQQMREALEKVNDDLWRCYPTEGAWSTTCPYCHNRTGAGKVSHKSDCLLVTVEAALALPAAQQQPAPAAEQSWADDLKARIQDYLGNGGLFNPELMEHEKVRDLLMECRDYLAPPSPAQENPVEARVEEAAAILRRLHEKCVGLIDSGGLLLPEAVLSLTDAATRALTTAASAPPAAAQEEKHSKYAVEPPEWFKSAAQETSGT